MGRATTQPLLERCTSTDPSGDELTRMLDRAYQQDDRSALEAVQTLLASIHDQSFEVPNATDTSLSRISEDLDTSLAIEERMLAFEGRQIDMADAPPGDGGAGFVRGLKRLIREHPANRHPFYISYLPDRADVSDLAFYLSQESALDPRFDDFIALMQIGMAVGPKLELASNYWDEMGNGAKPRVHTVMFQNALDEVGATRQYIAERQMVEAVVCGNLAALLVLRRPLIYRAVGCFAVTEFLFPRRCSQLLQAWRRNGLSTEGVEYHREHVGIDARHASGFFSNVIVPLVDKNPDIGPEIYWGAMARLNSSQRYLDATLSCLGNGDRK